MFFVVSVAYMDWFKRFYDIIRLVPVEINLY